MSPELEELGQEGRAAEGEPAANRLHLDTVLQRRDEIELTLTATGLVEIETSRGRKKLPGHVLPILDVFSSPTTFRYGLETLGRRAHGTADFRSMSETLIAMVEHGALVDSRARRVGISREPRSYSGSKVHVGMLNDRVRTRAFLDAISDAVQPGDVVIDLGSGTGILAIHAARAGAARVFAIEASSIADVTAQSVRTNHVSDRITIVRGWSKAVELPEKADVLVSELIGNDPFDEDFIAVISDARDRFLKPGGKILPSRLTAFAQPFEIPGQQIDRLTFTAANSSAWEQWYGVKFADFARVAVDTPHFVLTNPGEVEGWKALAEPIALLEFSPSESAPPDGTFERLLTFTESGLCNGLLLYFEAELGPGVRLTTRPGKVAASNHWACRVWLFPGGFPTSAGSVGHLGLTCQRGIFVQSFSVE